MLSRLLDPASGLPRDRVFWLVLAAVACSQLLAFYLLCSHQVRRAEARRAAVQVQQLAARDCLQYLANSTIGSCAPSGFAAAQARPAPAQAGHGATPVSLAWQ
ncbi:MAG TPA: hypothetical protein VFE82_16890 [Ramlibacter sp.]|uniref:hypothetical protein n=1 Tax=Ramlibacter sp. TaxID=1917967 RepID=UPI002D25E29B|nr:hypothetical protein [Ramlibacter sp.]HZY20149.1 hypothetical protein [Ramlibacter sp.]